MADDDDPFLQPLLDLGNVIGTLQELGMPEEEILRTVQDMFD